MTYVRGFEVFQSSKSGASGVMQNFKFISKTYSKYQHFSDLD
jgi:hypothetical protein